MVTLESLRVHGRRAAGWALALTLCLPAGLAAQELERARPDERGMPADVRAAQTFMLAAYPDLIGRPLEVRLRREGAAVLVSVADLSVPAAPGTPPVPIVTARFDYDAGARLRRYDAYGPLLEEARNLTLRLQMAAHPRWIDSDADVALTRAGAASTFGTPFAPNGGAAGVIEQQVGASRTAAPARFLWYGDTGAEVGTAATFRSRPVWVTEATATGASGERLTYQFEYEPFGGRLVSVVRR